MNRPFYDLNRTKYDRSEIERKRKADDLTRLRFHLSHDVKKLRTTLSYLNAQGIDTRQMLEAIERANRELDGRLQSQTMELTNATTGS